MRDMVMVGFLQAQNCSNFAGSWRHPDARSDFAESQVGFLKQLCSNTHAPAGQIAVRWLAHRCTEVARESGTRQTSYSGEIL